MSEPSEQTATSAARSRQAGLDREPVRNNLLRGTSENTEKLIVVALFIVAIACYANTLTNGFVYDDDQQILLNPYIKSWHFLPEIFTTTVWSFVGSAGSSNYYRPLMTLTYLVLWKTFGDLPFGYHLFNVVLNAFVVVAVYYAGGTLLRARASSAIAALFFAIHPIHTETVCWIAAVPDLEATLLILMAFRSYTKVTSISSWRQMLVVVPFLLALLAKEPALMTAPLLVIYEHFVREDHAQTTAVQKVSRYIPVCLAGAAYLACRVLFLGKLAPVLQHAQISWRQAILSAFALIGNDTKLLLWPSSLSAFHVFHASNSPSEPAVVFGIAVVVLTIGLIAATYRKHPEVAYSLVWIGFTLAPVLNSRWMAANVLAERYLYLPSIGLCWLAGWAIVRAWVASAESKLPPGLLRPAMACAVAAFSILGAVKTVARNRDWRDDLRLYTTTLKTDPDSYVMHLNLGASLFQNRDYPRAESELKQALVLRPDSVNAMNALGCLYLETGRLEDSAMMFQRAIELKPLWTDPHYNYGRLLAKTDRPEALREFRKAVETGPVNSSARLYLALTLAENGDLAEAESEFRKSLELSDTLEAEHGLIDILLMSGRTAEAESRMRMALNRYPFDGALHLKLAKLLEAEGNKAESLKEYKAAEETDSRNEEIRAAIERLTAKK